MHDMSVYAYVITDTGIIYKYNIITLNPTLMLLYKLFRTTLPMHYYI